MMQADTVSPKISFVVPVYNAQAYLAACLDSICCQLSGNELILIDDGSKDASGGICDRYQQQYEGVLVIHTENRGVSAARNLGAEVATGEYIAYIDSDDWINPEFALEFAQLGLNADVIFYPVQKLFEDGTIVPMEDGIQKQCVTGKTSAEVLAHLSVCPKFPASPWGKLVRNAFLKENGICFAFNRISEDYDWMYSVLQYAQSYGFFEEGLYTYRQVENSRSARGSTKSVEDQLAILHWWEQKEVDAGYRMYLNAFLAYEYAMILPFYGALNRKQRSGYRKTMKQSKHILRHGKTRKLKLISAAVRLLGVDLAAILLHQFVRLRNKAQVVL